MLLYWLMFIFIAFGAKLLLAIAMIYLILSADRVCNVCDAETIPIRMGPVGRLLSWISRGAVQRRWCPRCGWEGLTRSGRMNKPGSYAPAETEPGREVGRKG
jgi:hypothetical protein